MRSSRLASLSILLGLAAPAFAGSLEPPGPPAPTMKTLVECEPRTALLGPGPFVISAPGSYYLTENVQTSDVDGIRIAVSGVELDLAGFTVRTAQPNMTRWGLHVEGVAGVTVRNGHFADSANPVYVVDSSDVLLEELTTGTSYQQHFTLWRSDVTVRGCSIRGGSFQSVSISNAVVRLWDTFIQGGGPAAVMVSDDSVVDVRRCTIVGAESGIRVDSDRFGGGVSRGVIMDNVVTRCTSYGIRVEGAAMPDLRIARNLSFDNGIDYDIGLAAAAPVVSISAGPAAWDNVK